MNAIAKRTEFYLPTEIWDMVKGYMLMDKVEYNTMKRKYATYEKWIEFTNQSPLYKGFVAMGLSGTLYANDRATRKLLNSVNFLEDYQKRQLAKYGKLSFKLNTRNYALADAFKRYSQENYSNIEYIMELAGWENYYCIGDGEYCEQVPDTLFDTPVFPKIKLNRFPLIQPAQPQQAKPVVVYTGRKVLVNLKTKTIIREL